MAKQPIPRRYPKGQAPKTCIVDGCNGKTVARGYCGRHYHHICDHGHILKRTQYDPNGYTVDGEKAFIHLYDKEGKKIAETIIDSSDLEYVLKEKWCLTGRGHVRNSSKPRVRLSRYIMAPVPHGYEIDHINRDTMDNRRSNLRLATHLQNCANTARRKNISGYKGVYLDRRINRWWAEVCCDGSKYYLGVFSSRKKAAMAYNKKALELFGEFALLNDVVG